MNVSFPDRPDGHGRAPEGQLIQLCFVVADLDQAMAQFSGLFGVGPWFVGPEQPADAGATVYRGVPTPLGARVALGYAGEMMYELVCPQIRSRSIFREWADTRGYALHHFGFAVSDFDATLRAIEASGFEALTTSTTPRGARIVMIETNAPLGALAEYIEITPANRAFYAFMQSKAAGWDRRTLVHDDAAGT